MSDSTTPQDDAAMSPASSGSVPVAWAVVYPNDEVAVIAFKRQDADGLASASDRVVPLYRSPTLTDAEREAVCMAMTMYEFNDNDDQCAKIAATLRGLLERLK